MVGSAQFFLHVVVVAALLREGLPAQVTSKGPLPSVDAAVLFEMMIKLEAFPANVTSVGAEGVAGGCGGGCGQRAKAERRVQVGKGVKQHALQQKRALLRTCPHLLLLHPTLLLTRHI